MTPFQTIIFALKRNITMRWQKDGKLSRIKKWPMQFFFPLYRRWLITRNCLFPNGKSEGPKCARWSVRKGLFFCCTKLFKRQYGGSLIFVGTRTPWHVTNLPRNSIPTATGDNYRPPCCEPSFSTLSFFRVSAHRWFSVELGFFSSRWPFLLLFSSRALPLSPFYAHFVPDCSSFFFLFHRPSHSRPRSFLLLLLLNFSFVCYLPCLASSVPFSRSFLCSIFPAISFLSFDLDPLPLSSYLFTPRRTAWIIISNRSRTVARTRY